jgi:hypothetical protein
MVGERHLGLIFIYLLFIYLLFVLFRILCAGILEPEVLKANIWCNNFVIFFVFGAFL